MKIQQMKIYFKAQFKKYIEMQRIQSGNGSVVKAVLVKMFISPSTLPQFMEKFFMLLQFFAYTVFVSSGLVDHPKYHTEFLQLKVLLAMLALLLLRAFTSLSLIRVFYIPFLVWLIVNQFEPLIAVNGIILFLSLLIDVLGRVEVSVCSENPHSQTINSVKFLHYGVLVFTTLWRFLGNQLIEGEVWSIYLLNFLLFVLLTFVKSRSKCRNGEFKALILRFYCLTLFYNILMISEQWVSLESVYSHLLVIVLSQVVYTLVDLKFGVIQISSFISEGNNLDLFFIMMSYKFGIAYDEEYEKGINDLLGVSNQIDEVQERSSLMDQPQIQPNSNIVDTHENLSGGKSSMEKRPGKEVLLELAEKFKELLEEEDDLRGMLFKAQVALYMEKKIVPVKLLLQKIKSQCPSYSFLQRIQAYKLQLELREQITLKYKEKKCLNFKEFVDNECFRLNLIRSAYDYITLWQYTKNSELVFEKLRILLDKIIRRKKLLHEQFRQLGVKCKSIILYYIDYLYNVEKNVQSTNAIARETTLLSDMFDYIHIDKKIYLLIGTENDNRFKIKNIGYNVSKLLGFERRELKRASASIFIPQFFKKAHEKHLYREIMEKKSDDACFFRKKSIVRHHDGFYLPCNVALKMVYDEEGELYFEGFVEILEDKTYDWYSFVMVSHEDGELIEVGPTVQNLLYIPKGSNLSANEFFSQQVESQHYIDNQIPSIRIAKIDGISYEYVMYKNFVLENQNNIYYYVCKSKPLKQSKNNKQGKSTFFPSASSQLKTFNQGIRTFDRYNCKDQEEIFLDEYFKRRQHVQQQITANTLWIVLCLSIFLLLCIIGVEVGVFVYSTYTQMEQKELMDNTKIVRDHYLNLNKLSMDVNMLFLNLEHGYSLEDYNLSMVQSVLIVQQTNNKLLNYSSSYYKSKGTIYDRQMIVNEIITLFISEIYEINYFHNNKQLKLNYLHNIHQLFKKLLIDSYDDYFRGLEQELDSYYNNSQIINYMFLFIIIVMVVIILLLLLKVEVQVRENQFEVLDLFTTVRCSQGLINPIYDFLATIVGDTTCMPDDKLDQSQFGNETLKMETEINRTMLSSRENTGREFIDGGFGKKMNQDNEEKKKNDSLQRNDKENKSLEERKNRLKGRSKKFISIMLLFFFGILTFHCIVGVKKVNNEEYSLSDSCTNLMKLLKFQTAFSVMIVAFIDSISHELNREFFDESVKMYRDSSEFLMDFPEIAYPQFKQFKQIWQNIQYNYICQYTNCLSEYENYINIVYSTTSEKFHNYMQDNFQVAEITDNTIEFRSMIYFDSVFAKIVSEFFNSYMDGYKSYISMIVEEGYILTSLTIGFTGFAILALLLFCCCKIRKRNMIEKQMLEIIKPDSFLNVTIEEEDKKCKE